MRILLWHVHGSWTTAFVQGPHEYLLPVLPDRGPDGLGRARSWDWPTSVREVPPSVLPSEPVDVLIVQRPHELALAERWLGRGVPTVYLEHNTPAGSSEWGVTGTRHPVAGRDDIPLVHVTHFNALFWDNGIAPVRVVEHGVIDPGPRYSGELARAAVVVNDPVTRGRIVGIDLLPRVAATAGVDVFGMRVTGLAGALGLRANAVGEYEDLPQHLLHQELARRRVYVHLTRWTSLGLSLVEAMTLGMPVVVLGTTAAMEAVPEGAGVVSTDVDRLVDAVRMYLSDPGEARRAGDVARAGALRRFGLRRFLADWDAVLKEVVA